MEELQTRTMNIKVGGETIACEIKERDFGDMIVHDVSSKGNYLFTLSQQGDVLFNEYEVGHQKNIIDPRQLNEIIEAVKEKIHADPL